MTQLSIDFTQRARRSDPATSQAAARNADKFASSHAGRILAALKAHGPKTAHEMHTTGLPELSKLGLAKVVKLDDGADMVRGGFRVWMAV